MKSPNSLWTLTWKLMPQVAMHSCAPWLRLPKNWASPFVSGALLRGGFIGRVQRRALDTDAPISNRPKSSSYPPIPPGDAEFEIAEPDLGCSAPVNNAAPASVLACASLITQMAIDTLTERFEFDDEVIDVYRRLPDAPFNRVGRYQRPAPNVA